MNTENQIQELKNCWQGLTRAMLSGCHSQITDDNQHLGMFSVPGNRIDAMNDCFSQLEWDGAMNIEKQIAQTILDAQKMREESYVCDEEKPFMIGEHKLDIETCLKTAGEKNGLSSNMWILLGLAMHWWNDIQLWAEDVLAGKDVEADLITPDEIMKAQEKTANIEADENGLEKDT